MDSVMASLIPCPECKQLRVRECSDIIIDAGLTPNTVYYWTVTDQFGNEYTSDTVTDAEGILTINEDLLPDGLLVKSSSPITVTITSDEDGNEPVELEYTSGVYTTTSYDCVQLFFFRRTDLISGVYYGEGEIALSESHVDAACFAGATGSINLAVVGGVPPYFYDWSNGATTQDISGLEADDYDVIVTDSNGNTAILLITVGENAIILNLSHEDVTVFGGSDGEASVVATGGTPPYIYQWNTDPVQTTQTITGLEAGSYTVRIMDANGCIVQGTVEVEEPAFIAGYAYSYDYGGAYDYGSAGSEALAPMFGVALGFLTAVEGSIAYYTNPVWNALMETVGFKHGAVTGGAEPHWIRFASHDKWPGSGYLTCNAATVEIPNVGMRVNLCEIYFHTESTGDPYALQKSFNDTGIDFLPKILDYIRAHNQKVIFTCNASHGTVAELGQYLTYIISEHIAEEDIILRYGNEEAGEGTGSTPGVAQTGAEYLTKVTALDDYVLANFPAVRRIIYAREKTVGTWNNTTIAAFAKGTSPVRTAMDEVIQYFWLDVNTSLATTEPIIWDYFQEAKNQVLSNIYDANPYHITDDGVLQRLEDLYTLFDPVKIHIGQYGCSLQRTKYVANTMLHGIMIWDLMFEFLKFNQTHDHFINSAVFITNESAVSKKGAGDGSFTIQSEFKVTDTTSEPDIIFVKRIQGVAYEMLNDLAAANDMPVWVPITLAGTSGDFDAICYQFDGRTLIYCYNLEAAKVITSIVIDGIPFAGTINRTTVYADELWGSIGFAPAHKFFNENGSNPGYSPVNVVRTDGVVSGVNVEIKQHSITVIEII